MKTLGAARLALIVLTSALGCGGSGLGPKRTAPTTDAGSDRTVELDSRGGADPGESRDVGFSGGLGDVPSAVGSGGIGGTGGTGGSAGIGGRGGTGGSAGIGGRGGSAGSGGCTSICNVDYPCGYYGNDIPKCVLNKPNSILAAHDVSCQEVCGTPCCSGGGCRRVVEDCPVGAACAYPSATATTRSASLTAKCVPESQTCGGSQNKPCPVGQYCERFGVLCPDSLGCPSNPSSCEYANGGGLGTCWLLPTAAECSALTEPVCGCDGVTYANDCVRMATNVTWSHAGSCLQGRVDAGRDATGIKDVPPSSDQGTDASSDLDDLAPPKQLRTLERRH